MKHITNRAIFCGAEPTKWLPVDEVVTVGDKIACCYQGRYYSVRGAGEYDGDVILLPIGSPCGCNEQFAVDGAFLVAEIGEGTRVLVQTNV